MRGNKEDVLNDIILTDHWSLVEKDDFQKHLQLLLQMFEKSTVFR